MKLHVAGEPVLHRNGHGPAAGSARPVKDPWVRVSVPVRAPRNVDRYSRRSAHAGRRVRLSCSSLSTVIPLTETIFMVTMGARSTTGEPAAARDVGDGIDLVVLDVKEDEVRPARGIHPP